MGSVTAKPVEKVSLLSLRTWRRPTTVDLVDRRPWGRLAPTQSSQTGLRAKVLGLLSETLISGYKTERIWLETQISTRSQAQRQDLGPCPIFEQKLLILSSKLSSQRHSWGQFDSKMSHFWLIFADFQIEQKCSISSNRRPKLSPFLVKSAYCKWFAAKNGSFLVVDLTTFCLS